MQPLSGNQRPDLLTALMKMSLVLRLPRKMHLCRSCSNVPQLPSFLEMLQNHQPPRFAHFWPGAQSLAPATRNDIWTSKNAPNPAVFCTFDFKVVFAPCTFSTSQLLKMLRSWGVLHMFTWKCASRALFRHRNFQKWSEHVVFCKLGLGNVLLATTACNFSSLIWPAGSAPAALASLLFDPPEPQIIGKTQCFATFLPFRTSASSFFWSFLFWLFSPLLFNCPYCRKFHL